MRRPLLAVLAVPLAVLAGCAGTGTGSSGGKLAKQFHGQAADVAAVLDTLSSAVSARDGQKMCTLVLSHRLAQQLAAGGRSCAATMERQLKAVDDPTLKVRSIHVQGNRATAQVRTTVSGMQRNQVLTFVRQGQVWRLDGLGS